MILRFSENSEVYSYSRLIMKLFMIALTLVQMSRYSHSCWSTSRTTSQKRPPSPVLLHSEHKDAVMSNRIISTKHNETKTSDNNAVSVKLTSAEVVKQVQESPVLLGMFDTAKRVEEVDSDMLGTKIDGAMGMTEPVCGSTPRYIIPRMARNKKGVMMFIINQPENRTELTQLVKVTMCHNEGEKCHGGLSWRTVSHCKQEYTDHKLVAISEDQKHVVIDTFSFPSCCTCHIRKTVGFGWS